MLEKRSRSWRARGTGEVIVDHGRHYTVENVAFTRGRPNPVPVLVSGFGPKATDLAARIADGYVNTKPDKELVQRTRVAVGGPKAAGVKISGEPTRTNA